MLSAVKERIINATLYDSVMQIEGAITPDYHNLEDDDFSFLHECFLLAEQAEKTSVYAYLKSIHIDCWPAIKQLATAIQYKNSALVGHAFTEHQKNHGNSLFSTIMSVNGFSRFICLITLCSNNNGFLNEKTRYQRISFLVKHLTQDERILLATNRYAHHFYKTSSAIHDPIGIANDSIDTLTRIAINAVSVSMQRHVLFYIMRELNTYDFTAFINNFCTHYDNTITRYESGSLWFNDDVKATTLAETLSFTLSYFHVNDMLADNEIKGGNAISPEMARFANNRSVVYKKMTECPEDDLIDAIKDDGPYVVRFFIQRCSTTDNFIKHPFWDAIKKIDGSNLENNLNNALKALFHPAHIDTMTFQWPDVFKQPTPQMRQMFQSVIDTKNVEFSRELRNYPENQQASFKTLYLLSQTKLMQSLNCQTTAIDIESRLQDDSLLDGAARMLLLPESEFVDFCKQSNEIVRHLSDNNDFILLCLTLKKPPTFWIDVFDDISIKGIFLKKMV